MPSGEESLDRLPWLSSHETSISWIVLVAEGKLEFAGNLWPKFAEDVETHVFQQGVAHISGGRSDTRFVVWVIEVAQRNSACRAQPFGKIEHALAIFLMRHHGVSECMQKAPSRGAGGQPVIPRVF